MAKSIIIILTEGDHDSAFLARILKANGFRTFKSVIKDYPPPLSGFLLADTTKIRVDEARLEAARRTRFLPSYALEFQETLILIYAVGGDTRDDIRVSLIKTLDTINVADEDAFQVIESTGLAVLYFLDADDQGVNRRCMQIHGELSSAFDPTLLPNTLESGQIYDVGDMKVGSYIFSEKGSDHGKLEDVLIPLMQKGNDDVFGAATEFLAIHSQSSLYGERIEVDAGGKVIKVCGQKFDHKKSLICTVGQLEKSGKSNTVCISDSSFLNAEKITDDHTCREIFSFIQKVII